MAHEQIVSNRQDHSDPSQTRARPVTALRSQKTIGLTLAIFGALLLTPDTLFMRLSQLDGLNMLLWRGGLSGLAYFMIWLWMRSPRDLSNIWTGNFAIIVACQIGNAALFSLAIAIAPVTVVLIGVATVPIFAAILSRLILGEALSTRTLITSALVVLGLFISVLGGDNGQIQVRHQHAHRCGTGTGGRLQPGDEFHSDPQRQRRALCSGHCRWRHCRRRASGLSCNHRRLAASPTDGRHCFDRNFHPPTVICHPLLCGPICPLLHREPHHVAGNSFGPFMGLVGH